MKMMQTLNKQAKRQRSNLPLTPKVIFTLLPKKEMIAFWCHRCESRFETDEQPQVRAKRRQERESVCVCVSVRVFVRSLSPFPLSPVLPPLSVFFFSPTA